jgi:hypothetical protein
MITPVNEQNPWPGLDAFDEASSRFFHGRDEEVEQLLRRVTQSPLTLLFGKSGLGKSSLLMAGLLPRLRETHYLPVYLRIDLQAGAPAPVMQMRDALRTTLAQERFDAPAMTPDEPLWSYLHRAGLEFWSPRNFCCTPVFVLDQFEEVFTLGDRLPEVMAGFKIDLGDLAENRIPAALAGADLGALELRSMGYKLLLSLREDFLPELESWRAAVPSLAKMRMRLLPLQPAQALAAVHQAAPQMMDLALARRIVDFVAAAQAPAATNVEIEPALLSLFCHGLNLKRLQQNKPQFDDALLDGAKQGILADYYRSCFEGMPDSVSRWVATDLITEKGFRNSVSKDDAIPAQLSEEQLSRLIDRRLLRMEERHGAMRIELTHDLLTRVVREQRDALRFEEQARQRELRIDAEQRAERERRLESEARAGRTFRRLAAALGAALVLACAAAAVAVMQSRVASVNLVAAEKAHLGAEASRAEADRQRAIAQARLKRIEDSIGMKQAVLSGDRARFSAYLEASKAGKRLRFTAVATSLGYRNPQGQTVYKFSLMPDTSVLQAWKKSVAVVTYRMDHPTFQNALLATGPDRDFTASYTGWGCLRNVVVLVEYVDPDEPARIANYDMCEALGW